MQLFKTVYFPDLPHGPGQKRGLTIAFNNTEPDVRETISALNSLTLRRLIGHTTFNSLAESADQSGLSINAYCRERIQDCLTRGEHVAITPGDLALQATFAGGRGSPLHDWFPFLEGYSPDFVVEAVRRFAPSAKTILDPFAGSGTTPISVMMLGRTGPYCEVNPLCQLLISAKVNALKASEHERISLAHALEEAANDWASMRRPPRARDLEKSYIRAFGSSEFFDPNDFDRILRARTYIDRIEEVCLANLLAIAATRSLIPASKLIRRGDLRFKNQRELERGETNFDEEFAAALRLIAADLKHVEHVSGDAHFVGGDSRLSLARYGDRVDAVVTSPPYLNGTNYFRNTKIELWFLRSIKNGADLRAFRDMSITSGINDVTVTKVREGRRGLASDSLNRTLSELSRSAYDVRIPLMVEGYFSDLLPVFEGICHIATPGAPIVVDIGDSFYGGVHVATDTILTEMLSALNVKREASITLRERMSRGGFPLKQSLLVFRTPLPKKVRRTADAALWEQFKSDLPHQKGRMAARNWGHPLHSLCSYQGKLKPSLAHSLVQAFVPEGGRILDPFAGVGTIPFEAALNGRKAYGFEISPSAYMISDAKLRKPDAKEIDELLAQIEKFITSQLPSKEALKAADLIRFNSAISDYFHPMTLREILSCRKFLRDSACSSAAFSLVHSCMQHILHGNRPYALSRRSHPITPFAPTGETEYRALMPRLREKISRSLSADRGPTYVEGKVWERDCTLPWPDQVSDLDAVITSPPFFDSTRFYLANWMRVWFSGWEAEDFRTRPQNFVDERQKKSFSVYDSVLRQARERLKPGGFVVLHLGSSRKCDMASELLKIAAPYFGKIDLFVENVEHCESHGIRDKGTVTAHQYLVLA